MTDDTEQPYLDKTQKDSPPASRVSFFQGIVFLFLLLTVVLAIFVFYTWQHLQVQNKALLRIDSELTQQTQTIAKFHQQLRQTQASKQQQAQYIKQNEATIKHILDNLTGNENAWLMTDAKHLIKLANLILVFEHDVKTSVTLLKTANQRLYATGDPDLNQVRKSLANDIAELNAVPKVDISGIYLQLSTLRKKTNQLRLAANQYQVNTKDNLLSQTQAASDSWWDKSVASTAHALGQVLVIRRRDQPIEPLLSSKQHLILSQNIYLLYSQAQWALLHRQKSIYQSSIQRLIHLIDKYYVPNHQSEAILKSLNKLVKTNIAPELPDITDSLTALNQYKQQAKQRQLTQPANKKRSAK